MTEDLDNSEITPSKSQRKREMKALQELGQKLISFKNNDLDRLPLSKELRTALAEYKKLPNSHEARRRQLQYIGKLMRDFEIEEIENAISRLTLPSQQKNSDANILKNIVSRIVSDDGTEIEILIAKHPLLERQVLRQYLREHAKADLAAATDKSRAIEARLTEYLKANMDLTEYRDS